MINSNLIKIGIAGIGIALLITVGMEKNLFQEAAAGGLTFPTTECEIQGGIYDHWDKIIFVSTVNTRDNLGALIKPGVVLEFKFPQSNPFAPVNPAQLVADHLNMLSWTNGAGNAILAKRIFIIDVDYSAACIFPQP